MATIGPISPALEYARSERLGGQFTLGLYESQKELHLKKYVV